MVRANRLRKGLRGSDTGGARRYKEETCARTKKTTTQASFGSDTSITRSPWTANHAIFEPQSPPEAHRRPLACPHQVHLPLGVLPPSSPRRRLLALGRLPLVRIDHRKAAARTDKEAREGATDSPSSMSAPMRSWRVLGKIMRNGVDNAARKAEG